MIHILISDVSKVLLFPKDKNYQGSLNNLHKELSKNEDYKFFDHFELNLELLNFYKSLKNKVDLYIFTSETIQETPTLQEYFVPVFTKIFSALKMNISKKDPEAYEAIIKELNLNSDEIIYIDDNLENIKAAQKSGINVIQYLNNKQTIEEIIEKLEIIVS